MKKVEVRVHIESESSAEADSILDAIQADSAVVCSGRTYKSEDNVWHVRQTFARLVLRGKKTG